MSYSNYLSVSDAHTSFMISISEHEEDVLQNGDEELLEKYICSVRIGFRHVVDELNAHAKSSILDLSVIVFAGPHAGVDDELELALIKSKQSWEAMVVDGLKKLKELYSMFGVLMEIFVDHIKGAFEHVLHDDWDFVFHHAL